MSAGADLYHVLSNHAVARTKGRTKLTPVQLQDLWAAAGVRFYFDTVTKMHHECIWSEADQTWLILIIDRKQPGRAAVVTIYTLKMYENLRNKRFKGHVADTVLGQAKHYAALHSGVPIAECLSTNEIPATTHRIRVYYYTEDLQRVKKTIRIPYVAGAQAQALFDPSDIRIQWLISKKLRKHQIKEGWLDGTMLVRTGTKSNPCWETFEYFKQPPQTEPNPQEVYRVYQAICQWDRREGTKATVLMLHRSTQLNPFKVEQCIAFLGRCRCLKAVLKH